MTAHNLPILKFIEILNQMLDEGYEKMDIIVEDDLTVALIGVREEEEVKEEEPKEEIKEEIKKDINLEDAI